MIKKIYILKTGSSIVAVCTSKKKCEEIKTEFLRHTNCDVVEFEGNLNVKLDSLKQG